jgi:hypothetical protein
MDQGYSERAARELWQSQKVEPRQFSPEELGRLQRYFNRKIWWRNAREYAAGVLVFIFFGWSTVRAPNWEGRVGSALIVIGGAYVLWHLHQHGSARPETPGAAAGACRGYYRANLERQRRLLAGVPRWYLAPFAPGYVMLVVSKIRFFGGVTPNIVVTLVLGAVVTVAVLWLNAKGATQLEQRLRALDAIDSPNPS